MERRTITLENHAGVLCFVQIPALVNLPSIILWRGRAFYFVEDELYTEADCYDAGADPVTTTAPSGERGDAPKLEALEGGLGIKHKPSGDPPPSCSMCDGVGGPTENRERACPRCEGSGFEPVEFGNE